MKMYTNKQHQSNKLYQSTSQSDDRSSIRKLSNKHIRSMKLSEGPKQIGFCSGSSDKFVVAELNIRSIKFAQKTKSK